MLGVQMRHQLQLMKILCRFGHDIHFESDNTFDFISLQAKFFIYKRKINKTIPQFHLFKHYLKSNFDVYKYNAKLNMSLV